MSEAMLPYLPFIVLVITLMGLAIFVLAFEASRPIDDDPPAKTEFTPPDPPQVHSRVGNPIPPLRANDRVMFSPVGAESMEFIEETRRNDEYLMNVFRVLPTLELVYLAYIRRYPSDVPTLKGRDDNN